MVAEEKFFLPVKFRQILISGFREEGEHVSANQSQRRSSWFSDRPEKKSTNLVEDIEFLLPVKV